MRHNRIYSVTADIIQSNLQFHVSERVKRSSSEGAEDHILSSFLFFLFDIFINQP